MTINVCCVVLYVRLCVCVCVGVKFTDSEFPQTFRKPTQGQGQGQGQGQRERERERERETLQALQAVEKPTNGSLGLGFSLGRYAFGFTRSGANR